MVDCDGLENRRPRGPGVRIPLLRPALKSEFIVAHAEIRRSVSTFLFAEKELLRQPLRQRELLQPTLTGTYGSIPAGNTF